MKVHAVFVHNSWNRIVPNVDGCHMKHHHAKRLIRNLPTLGTRWTRCICWDMPGSLRQISKRLIEVAAEGYTVSKKSGLRIPWHTTRVSIFVDKASCLVHLGATNIRIFLLENARADQIFHVSGILFICDCKSRYFNVKSEGCNAWRESI